MLYVSRLLHPAELSGFKGYKDTWERGRDIRYGVVDTDDGVEQIASLYQLGNCLNNGLEVKGVVSDRGYITSVRPYQDERFMTVAQTKLELISGVGIRRYKRAVTDIVFDGRKIAEPVTVRLSDFGTKCADYLFANAVYCQRHALTLVLDDRIKFTKYSFSSGGNLTCGIGVDGVGVMFDICDVTNQKRAELVYDAVIKSGSAIDSILDDPVRYREYYRSMRG